MPIRRVVTGHDSRGDSVFAADDQLEPLTSPGLPGVQMSYLWGADAPQQHPGDGTQPAWHEHFPPREGVRFVVFSLPPAGHGDGEAPPSAADVADADAKFPGLLASFERDDPGMHTSDTTDFAMVIRGEVVLELDGAAERTLRPGDVVVQNGTRHRWVNRGSERVDVAFVLVGAERA